MVGLQILDLPIGVRVPVSQPIKDSALPLTNRSVFPSLIEQTWRDFRPKSPPRNVPENLRYS
jgi:hypothetical protein